MPAREISTAAADPKRGMTLGELQDFIDDAFRAGFDTKDLIRARVRFGGQLQRAIAKDCPEAGPP